MKPSTQRWPDCAMRTSCASATAIARCDRSRASSIRPWWAAIIAAGNSAIGCAPSRPNCARSASESAAWRAADVPVARPPLEDAQQPQRVRLLGAIPGAHRDRATPRGACGRDRAHPTRRAGTPKDELAAPVDLPLRAATARARAPAPSARRGMPCPVRKWRNPNVASALHRSAASSSTRGSPRRPARRAPGHSSGRPSLPRCRRG